MRTIHKVGLLSLLVALPIILVGIFDFFSQNHYKPLKVYYDLRDPNFDPNYLKTVSCTPSFIDSTHVIPAFSLTNQDGETFTEKDLNGKIYVVDFVFTRCPTICITLSSEMVRVQEAFANNDDVNILSHSVDPAYDTPEVLQKYAVRYGANTNKWTFLTGKKQAIYEQARCGYFVVAAQDEEMEDIETFTHTDKVVLIDKNRRIRGYYTGTDAKEINRLITEIKLLLKEG